jgi:uncharacterized Zn-binding protein involved in type VI secretion
MAALAKMGGESEVKCTDGALKDPPTECVTLTVYGNKWDKETTQKSAAGSSDVLVNSSGTVRKGDAMGSHPDGDPCTATAVNHAPTLSTYSATVFVNSKNIGRIGDKYNSDEHFDHTISSGSVNVFAGG